MGNQLSGGRIGLSGLKAGDNDRPAIHRISMPQSDLATRALLDDCSRAALALLQDNLTEHGILAASRTDAAVARR